MSCGTPVVSVDRGAMGEIVGDGGVIAKTLNPQDIADALLRVVPDGAFRKRIQKNALKQAKRYNWKTFAQRVYQTFAQYEH